MRLNFLFLSILLFFFIKLMSSELDTVAGIVAAAHIRFDQQMIEDSKSTLLEMNLKDYFDTNGLSNYPNFLNKLYEEESKISSFISFHFPNMVNDSKVIMYPFGATDFMFPDRFFNNMKKLICIGQEKIGSIPTLEDLNDNDLKQQIAMTHQKVLCSLLDESYLITARMKEHYQETGALLTLALNIVLAGYEIVDQKRFYLQNSEEAVSVFYKGLEDQEIKEVIYINSDLLSSDLSSLCAYLDLEEIDAAFFKATSYLTQKSECEKLIDTLCQK